MSWDEFLFLSSFGTELTGEAILMVMKINTGLGNPRPFQELFIYEATSVLYKSPYLNSVHISLFNLISLNSVLIGLHKASGFSVRREEGEMGRAEEGDGGEEKKERVKE